MTNLDRRQLLSLGLILFSGSTAVCVAGGQKSGVRRFASAASDRNDQHWVSVLCEENGSVRLLMKLQLPGRGHHVAIHPDGNGFVAIARRPGNWLVIGSPDTGGITSQIRVPDDRHLYGHGVFSKDGSYFYTTESDFNDRENENGLVGVWEVNTSGGEIRLHRVAEFPTFGTGPHELVLMPDGQTLAIANGGMRTHPESEREVLNLDTMLPSLAYLDAASGKLLEQQFLPGDYHQASIRHMDVNAQGMVALGMQFQGEPWQQVPLIATHNRGEAFRLLLADEPVQGQMQQYVGSVRFSVDGHTFMASCPRGNQLTVWDTVSGKLLDSVRSRDGCGVCAVEEGFLFTAGTGKLALYNLGRLSVEELTSDESGLMWDNHLSIV